LEPGPSFTCASDTLSVSTFQVWVGGRLRAHRAGNFWVVASPIGMADYKELSMWPQFKVEVIP
jgi:hypothetical protein